MNAYIVNLIYEDLFFSVSLFSALEPTMFLCYIEDPRLIQMANYDFSFQLVIMLKSEKRQVHHSNDWSFLILYAF